jgi:hydrogenase maturation factor
VIAEGECADSCLTCSDAAVAGRILALLDDGMAIVAVGGHEQEVSVALVVADVGDTVAVHAGEAIAVMLR